MAQGPENGPRSIASSDSGPWAVFMAKDCAEVFLTFSTRYNT